MFFTWETTYILNIGITLPNHLQMFCPLLLHYLLIVANVLSASVILLLNTLKYKYINNDQETQQLYSLLSRVKRLMLQFRVICSFSTRPQCTELKPCELVTEHQFKLQTKSDTCDNRSWTLNKTPHHTHISLCLLLFTSSLCFTSSSAENQISLFVTWHGLYG